MEDFDYSQLWLSDKEERIFKASPEIFSEKGFAAHLISRLHEIIFGSGPGLGNK